MATCFRRNLAMAFAGIALVASAAAEQSTDRMDHSQHTIPDFSDGSKLNVAVFLYDGALTLDYGIAAEMFQAAAGMTAFSVFTISEEGMAAVNIFGDTETDFTFSNAPDADVIIIPGGPYWMQTGQDEDVIDYFEAQQKKGAILFSICSGGLLLAQTGLLENRNATTVHFAHHMMESISPTTNIRKSVFVDDGNIVTSAGAGTAMESTLAVIERLTTPEIARDLSERYLDYSLVTDQRRIENR